MEFLEFLKAKAQDFDKVLDSQLPMKKPERLYLAVRYLPMLGGKRLRPVMAYLCCRAQTQAPDHGSSEVYTFGTVLEMIHNFTLIHDDIMDDDDMRRGQPSVHVKFGKEAGINAGDALFAQSFESLANSELDPTIVKTLVKDVALMSRGIVEGQQMDVDFEKEPRSVTVEDYLLMIEKKTGLLFQIAAKGGAVIAKASPEEVRHMEEFGRLSGIAFQVCDDLLDVVGDEKVIGKPVGSDIRKGKKTLLVIHALQHGKSEDVATLNDLLGRSGLTQDDIDIAVSILERSGSIAHARKVADEYNDQAKAHLDTLPESEYKGRLLELMKFMVERTK